MDVASIVVIEPPENLLLAPISASELPVNTMPIGAPIPGKFEEDYRVHFDKTAGKWQYEDEESGQDYEWTGTVWIPLLDEDLIKAQQAAYAVDGVDENVPAAPVLAREEKKDKKRKRGDPVIPRDRRQEKLASTPSAPKKTGVWVTNLPPNTTPELLASVFSKAGVLLIGDDGQARVKMYYDDDGKFKGDALIMYFKEGSVDLAITLLDDTELELGANYGNMRVRVAEYDRSKPTEAKSDASQAAPVEKKKLSSEDKQRMSKRMRSLESKLAWHSDSDDDDETLAGNSVTQATSRFSRVVVLKGMFLLEDLEREPELLLELKEDVREEAESLGIVTSVVLYDKEKDGVITVKFKDPASAQACVLKMNGRYFDGRQIYAGIYSGKERYKKSGGVHEHGDEGGAEEQERLSNFAQWLMEGDE